MKIALIGYGKMGHTIEKIAVERGHKVVARVNIDNLEELESEEFKSADVAIEFTMPTSAYNNIVHCFKNNIPVVSGTTGWLEQYNSAVEECKKLNGGLLYASNYSIGVNIFFAINRELAKMMSKFQDYNVSMEEIHHVHKKDAPSGTAISLAEDIIKLNAAKQKWELKNSNLPNNVLQINAIREDEVPGVHSVKYENDIDSIEISHSAKNRNGFALGAVIAAEFMQSRKGVYNMKDVLGF